MLLKNELWEKWSIYNEDGFCGIDDRAPNDIKNEYKIFLEKRIEIHIDKVKEIIKKYEVNFNDELKKLVTKYCEKYPQRYDLIFPEANTYDEFKSILEQLIKF